MEFRQFGHSIDKGADREEVWGLVPTESVMVRGETLCSKIIKGCFSSINNRNTKSFTSNSCKIMWN